MNMSYLIYQAEHTPDPTTQREMDQQNGELAAAFARWLRRFVPRHDTTAPSVRPDCRYVPDRTLQPR
jgi:hypothetical protein